LMVNRRFRVEILKRLNVLSVESLDPSLHDFFRLHSHRRAIAVLIMPDWLPVVGSFRTWAGAGSEF
jgi:hypothetical protein